MLQRPNMYFVFNELVECCKAYYSGKESPLSDEQFDDREEFFRKYCPDHIYFKVPRSSWLEEKNDYKHNRHMGSISKVKGHDGKNIKDITYKLDGMALSAVYSNGVLLHIVTRGDGENGRIIKHFPRGFIKYLPEQLNDMKGDYEIRGELIYPREYYIPRSRQAVVGLSNAVNGNFDYSLNPHFIVYDLNGYDNKYNDFILVKSYGNNVEKALSKYLDERDSLPYDTDGVVIEHLDGGKVCIKPPAKEVETEVIDIKLNRGTTGMYVPVVYFTPININGVNARKASLSSIKNLLTKGIGIGSKIKVKLANEIIPHVTEVITKKEYIIPKCPNCNEELEIRGARLFCSKNCK